MNAQSTSSKTPLILHACVAADADEMDDGMSQYVDFVNDFIFCAPSPPPAGSSPLHHMQEGWWFRSSSLRRHTNSLTISAAKPANWERTEKSGATVLFVDPERKSTTLGVVVNPVRIEALEQFGTLLEVSKRLQDVEREKARPATRRPYSPAYI